MVSPYSATVVQPISPFEAYNPSFAFFDTPHEYEFGPRAPLGIAALLLIPERNPFLYRTNKDRFLESFDLLSMYDQLRYPSSVLLNPATSPDEIILEIEQDNIRIESSDGQPLVFRETSGADGLSRPFTPLIPPPLLALRTRSGSFSSVTGVYIASSGHSVDPNTKLLSVLEGGSVEPETHYSISLHAAATGGFSQSVSYGVPLDRRNVRIVLAPRLVAYYRTFTAHAATTTRLETDASGLPREVRTDTTTFLSYPGEGWGAGIRADAGTTLAFNEVRVGFSVLNIAGIDSVTGVEFDDSFDETPKTVTTIDAPPALVFATSYPITMGDATVEISTDALYNRSLSSHAGFGFFSGIFMSRFVVGFKGGLETATSVGIRKERGSVALLINSHESMFSKRTVWGIGVQGTWHR